LKRIPKKSLIEQSRQILFFNLAFSLEESEMHVLSRLVLKERKKLAAVKPSVNILVLTGIELFSMEGAPLCWEGIN